MLKYKNICYHVRTEDGTKTCGGTFGGELSLDTANRLVNSHNYSVRVTPSGRAVFVDDKGRNVHIYFSIDPRDTDKGKQALAERAKRDKELEKLEQAKQDEVESLLNRLSLDEIIAKLK